MKQVLITAVSFLFLFCVACDSEKERFYKSHVEEDLYRIPLIYPYRLIRLYGVEKDQGLTNSWDLRFHYEGDKTSPGFSYGVGVSEINVSKGIIYGYDYEQVDYPGVWFVIIPEKRIEKVFKNSKAQWVSFLRQNNISDIKLFPVWDIFNQFNDHSTVPWYKAGENTP